MAGTESLLKYAGISLILFLALLIPLLILRIQLKKGRFGFDSELLKKIRRKLTFPLVLLMALISITLPSRFFEFESYPRDEIEHLFSILLIVFVSWILIQTVALLKHGLLRRFDLNTSDNLKARRVYTQFKVLANIAVFLVLLVAISLILMTFEPIRQIGISLIASAGVAGIVIGFAAQKVLVTVLAGIQIAITQPIRIDDVVIVENEWGRIEEINLTYVVVRIWDQRRLVLPTTYFIETPFQNWTHTSAEILGTVFIYADYRLPVEEVRQELQRLLKDHPLWDGRVQNVQVTNATEKTVEIRLMVSAADSPTAWDLRVQMREKMLAFLQEKFPECLPRARIELYEKKA